MIQRLTQRELVWLFAFLIVCTLGVMVIFYSVATNLTTDINVTTTLPTTTTILITQSQQTESNPIEMGTLILIIIGIPSSVAGIVYIYSYFKK